MDSEKYLARIGIENAGLIPDLGVLKMLQRQHLLNVPFENLDIHWQRPIVLDTQAFYRKIVEENRGGFCYELNGLFNDLLRDIGFQTRVVSARVANADGAYGPEYDHLAILVIIGEIQYLADVGFGSFTTEPLELRPDVEQFDPAGVFVIKEHSEEYFEVARKNGEGVQNEYIFKPLGRDLSEFTEMCEFQQYSPGSHFRKGKICSILTETGRKTLTDNKFILTAGDKKNETAVASPDEFDTILLREFGIANGQPAISQISI